MDWLRRSCRMLFLGGQQRIEPPSAVEGVEVVKAADMGRADEDLRHGHASVGALDHLAPSFRIAGHVDLGENHCLAVQKRFGRMAIRAIASGVNLDMGHVSREMLSLGLYGNARRR